MQTKYLAKSAVIALLTTMSAGCMTAQTYEGPRQSRSEVAHIAGDMRFSGGAPISLVIRKVDDITLGVGQSSVDVLPGLHTLLIDCRLPESGGLSRHSIEADVSAGRTYRLVAETGPGLRECESIRLEGTD
jgi:hypothetical protein